MRAEQALQDTTVTGAATSAATALATAVLIDDRSLDEVIDRIARHFVDELGVEVFVAALTAIGPDEDSGWLRLGERAWVREWAARGSDRSILPPPGAGPEAVLTMPYVSARARERGLIAVVDVELLPRTGDEDRRELAAVGIRSLVTTAVRAQEQMFGSLSLARERPGAWPAEHIADLKLLNAALTARAGLEQARRSLLDSVAASARTREVNEQLLASVGHELRTPLSSVLGHTEMLMDEAGRTPDHPLAAAVQRDGDVIVDACEQLLALVDEVLDAGRTVQADDGRQLVDVPAAVDDVVHWHRTAARAADVTITSSVEPGLAVWAHSAGIRQVLSILVGNAVAHNLAGGSVAISARQLTGEVGDPRLRVLVRDDGPGLDRAQLAEAFKPYGRLEGSGLDGKGLGLSLSRSLAERDSGTIGAESTPGSGSVFWVELPMARTDSAEPPTLR